MRIITSVSLLFLVGCASEPERRYYNSEDKQDGLCYGKYGGMKGYCDAIETEKNFQLYPKAK